MRSPKRSPSPISRSACADAAEGRACDGVEFYGKIRPALGKAFLNEVKRGYAQVRREPLTGSPIEHDERKYVLKGYPFNLIYRFEEGTVVVLAVAHHSREPGYWRKR